VTVAARQCWAALGWGVVRIWEHESPVAAADLIEAMVRAE
jgi:hypothetical protein